MPDDSRIQVVHDHYKETFAIIREREGVRDRSFIALVGLFALLTLEVLHPSQTGSALRVVHVLGTDIDLSQLPLAYWLNASWTFVLLVALIYCRVTANIDRQYPYLHRLEGWMARALGDDDLYRREGRMYLSYYPVFLNWAWFAYVILFPGVVILACVVLVIQEWLALPYSIWHKGFDSGMALCVIISFLIYTVAPRLFRPFKDKVQGDQSRPAAQRSQIP
jgi:hypothetical protein